MELNFSFGTTFLLSLLACFLVLGLSDASFISDDIFAPQESTARNLLLTKTSCPVNFELMNYTVLTSKCKGPSFPPTPCCTAFKEFACPYSEQINDMTTDCATTMFSYIRIYGKYPAGIFSNQCREDKNDGLDCTNFTSNITTPSGSSRSPLPCSPFTLLLGIVLGFMGLLLI